MDETRIDAAPTPAHVFAYRAFRSVFVRSPESSPVRPQPWTAYSVFDHDQDQDKENARRSPARPPRFATSSVKSKRKDGEVNAPGFDQELNLTPKRQKTVPVSPTKSILKKPHAPTPRRAELRDVTVTFKDLRRSRSPEASKGSPKRARSQPAVRTLSENIGQQQLLPTVEISTNLTPRISAPITHLKRSTQDPNFDMDVYKAQTEREMRRLIKYGQKWKEQARRQDEENIKLRSLLEETRKENERLQKKIVEIHEPQEAESTRPRTKASAEEAAPSRKRWTPEFETEEGHRKRRQQEDKYQHEPLTTKQKSEGQRPKSARQSSLQQKLDELQGLQPSPPNNSKEDSSKAAEQQQRQPSLRKKIDLLKDATSEEEKSSLHKAQKEREKDATGAAASVPFDSSLDQDVQRLSLPVRTASLSAAEDRKAAARERLRMKREARAVSSQAVLSVGDKQKRVPDSSRLEADESQFDWAGIA